MHFWTYLCQYLCNFIVMERSGLERPLFGTSGHATVPLTAAVLRQGQRRSRASHITMTGPTCSNEGTMIAPLLAPLSRAATPRGECRHFPMTKAPEFARYPPAQADPDQDHTNLGVLCPHCKQLLFKFKFRIFPEHENAGLPPRVFLKGEDKPLPIQKRVAVFHLVMQVTKRKGFVQTIPVNMAEVAEEEPQYNGETFVVNLNRVTGRLGIDLCICGRCHKPDSAEGF